MRPVDQRSLPLLAFRDERESAHFPFTGKTAAKVASQRAGRAPRGRGCTRTIGEAASCLAWQIGNQPPPVQEADPY